MRNRLITGLSCGVLLIQAARKSGTVMYARFAKDQDRDVFVWPGERDSTAFAGGWDLIADGAKAVSHGEDILEEYAHRFQGLQKIVPLFPQSNYFQEEPLAALADPGQPQLTPEQAAVLDALGEVPQSVAQLEEAVGSPAGKLLGALTGTGTAGSGRNLPGQAVPPVQPRPRPAGETGDFPQPDHDR